MINLRNKGRIGEGITQLSDAETCSNELGLRELRWVVSFQQNVKQVARTGAWKIEIY